MAGLAFSVNSCKNDQDGMLQEETPHSPYESHFSQSELIQIDALINGIPISIRDNFRDKYTKWEGTWIKHEINVPSDLYLYAGSMMYDSILIYCKKYDKVVWPLLIDQVAHKDTIVINLLKDVTYDGDTNFFTDISQIFNEEDEKQDLSIHEVLMDYCKNLLADESDNILHSIQDIVDYFNNKYCFTPSDLMLIDSLIDLIPEKTKYDFEAKYKAWEEAWSRPEFVVVSALFGFTLCAEYDNLVDYSKEHNKIIWPLLINKFSKEMKVLYLLKDVTYEEGLDFFAETRQNIVEDGEPYIITGDVAVAYCKNMLINEKDNFIKSLNEL